MDKYHVYGIGNALVDMEFEVDPVFLEKLSIEKGVMTLVDEEKQKVLLEYLEGRRAQRACGGSAANTMIALAQLGGKGFYSYKVGNDEFGQFYQQNLKENGVFTQLNNGIYAGTTGQCLVMITPDADRTMNTFLGITQTFGVEQILEEELKKAEYLYIEGYLMATDSGRCSVEKAKKLAKSHGVKIALSFSDPFIVKTFKKELLEFLEEGIDFVFCNERECLELWNEEDLNIAAEKMKKVAKYFAVTLGGEGSLLFNGKSLIKIAPYPVKAVDTTGAGDMFAGALLYGLTHGMDFAQAGDLASKASSVVVSQFGPRLSKEKTQKILAEIMKKDETNVTKQRKAHEHV